MFIDSGAISTGEDQGPESDVEEKTLFGLIVGYEVSSEFCILSRTSGEEVLWVICRLIRRYQVVHA